MAKKKRKPKKKKWLGHTGPAEWVSGPPIPPEDLCAPEEAIARLRAWSHSEGRTAIAYREKHDDFDGSTFWIQVQVFPGEENIYPNFPQPGPCKQPAVPVEKDFLPH